ncbi:MAG: hypothetical protein M1436_06120 [Acidobacteria bacterium]|nr:hypothetical protein [Acidobacteriota bacterium]
MADGILVIGAATAAGERKSSDSKGNKFHAFDYTARETIGCGCGAGWQPGEPGYPAN